MRSDDLQDAAGFGNAVQLGDKTEHVGNMLDDVTTNDLFEFIVSERIWKRSQIVNDVCMTASISIDTDRAWKLVLTTADVENFFLHRSVFAQQQGR